MKNISLMLTAAVAIVLLTGTPRAQAWTIEIGDPQHNHECDAPLNGESIHQEHGPEDCGNTTTQTGNAPGAAEVCKDENTSANNTLLSGQYLSCTDTSGPSGGRGCDFTYITRCNGTKTCNINMGPNSDGSYPACWHGGPNMNSITCERRDSSGGLEQHGCSCLTNGTWYVY